MALTHRHAVLTGLPQAVERYNFIFSWWFQSCVQCDLNVEKSSSLHHSVCVNFIVSTALWARFCHFCKQFYSTYTVCAVDFARKKMHVWTLLSPLNICFCITVPWSSQSPCPFLNFWVLSPAATFGEQQISERNWVLLHALFWNCKTTQTFLRMQIKSRDLVLAVKRGISSTGGT